MRRLVTVFITVILLSITAYISWTAGILPVESFENPQFPPQGWKKGSKLGDLGGAGWQRAAVGDSVLGLPEGGLVDAPPGGGNFVALCSWLTGDADSSLSTPQATDQWLITPQILNIQIGDSLKFSLRYFSQFSDSLDVLISDTGDSLAAFDTLVTSLHFSGAGNNDWRQYRFALTDFAAPDSNIYIAFREHVANNEAQGDALLLDLVEVTSLVTGAPGNPFVPLSFELSQNYPNPFNPGTQISFSLPHSARVSLQVYNLIGQRVATVVDGVFYPAGSHQVTFEAGNLPSGSYFYKIEANDPATGPVRFVDVKKMTLLR